MLLLNLIYDTMKNYKNYMLNVTIGDSNDQYKKLIKPVILFLRIFKNLFSGKYIHFGTIASVNPNLIEEIFQLLCQLMFSIKIEDFLGYIKKTNVGYYIIKLTFCEYVKFINSENFAQYVDIVLKLIEEGLESLDNVSLITTHQIVCLRFL
jgi:hypothetical protein